MIIVTIIVLVFLGFHWLAQMSSDPSDLIAGLSTTNETGWQKAHALSDLLRDPTKDHLKDDVELAKQLVSILDEQIEESESETSSNEQQIRMRVYLCRALGEFRVPDVLPVLIKAATTERYEAELDVRDHATQAIAVCAKNLADKYGAESLHENRELMDAMLAVARERSDASDSEIAEKKKRDELRSAAAYTLGVIGGAEAFEKLYYMLDDAYPNAKFNAATGLARHGDERALPVLVEMLDPKNDNVTVDEESESEKLRKRGLVMMNAMRAVEQLHKKNPNADLQEVLAMLEELNASDLPGALRTRAKETSIVLTGS